MANKKSKKSGKGSGNNKPNPGKGSQVVRGSGKGTVQQSAPTTQKINLASRFGLKNDGTNGDVTITGSEIIGLANTNGSGRMVFIADLNPVTWAGSRVQRMIGLYETYRITSLKVTYIPSCPTTTGGLLYMYYDRDPNDAPIPTVYDPANLSRLMGNQNAVAGQAWKPLSMEYRSAPSDARGYYSAPVVDSADLRLTSQGMVYAYSSGAMGAITGGIFKFDYTIKLMTPTGGVLNKPTITPWTYGQINSLAGPPSSAYIPSGETWSTLLPAAMSVEKVVIEVILDYAVSLLVAGTVRVVAPYTPLYVRSLVGIGWQTYISLASALVPSTDYLNPPTTSTNGFGWARILVNLATNLMQET